MIKKAFFISVFLAVGILISCTPSNSMASWIGHPQSELYQSWGPPSNITSDGNGGQILIYASISSYQTPGQINTNSYGNSTHTTYTAPQINSYQRTRMFYVNADGIIYSWRWQGL
jgi:hypothetical protein